MAALDYDGIISMVQDRLNRTDLDSYVPNFITRLEDEINARLAAEPIRPMEAIYTLSSSSETIAIPSDMIDVIKLQATDGTDTWTMSRLEPADLNEKDFYATRALPYRIEYDSDKVQYYAIIGSNIRLGSTPDASLDYTLYCYQKVPAITSSNTTNWITESHSNVYEFGVLAHAAKQIRDDEYMQLNSALFDAAFASMVSAYPEKVPPTELRATDAPWATRRWNINSG
jgi:hypothetical protein